MTPICATRSVRVTGDDHSLRDVSVYAMRSGGKDERVVVVVDGAGLSLDFNLSTVENLLKLRNHGLLNDVGEALAAVRSFVRTPIEL
jgi:hypothetical protein